MLTKIQMNFFPFPFYKGSCATSLLLNIKELDARFISSLILLCYQECQDRVVEAEVVGGRKLLRGVRANLGRITRKNREQMRRKEERTKKFLVIIYQIVLQPADDFSMELNNHK